MAITINGVDSNASQFLSAMEDLRNMRAYVHNARERSNQNDDCTLRGVHPKTARRKDICDMVNTTLTVVSDEENTPHIVFDLPLALFRGEQYLMLFDIMNGSVARGVDLGDFPSCDVNASKFKKLMRAPGTNWISVLNAIDGILENVHPFGTESDEDFGDDGVGFPCEISNLTAVDHPADEDGAGFVRIGCHLELRADAIPEQVAPQDSEPDDEDTADETPDTDEKAS